MKVCAFFFVAGLLSILLASVNELFNLGIWHAGDYPVLGTDKSGASTTVPGSYGKFMVQFTIIVVASGVLGSILFVFVGGDE